MRKIWMLRRATSVLNSGDITEIILDKMAQTRTNDEFFKRSPRKRSRFARLRRGQRKVLGRLPYAGAGLRDDVAVMKYSPGAAGRVD